MLRVGLGLIEPTLRIDNTDELVAEHDLGHARGFEEARARFAVVYPCSICRRPITLESRREKEAAASYIVGAVWAHGSCCR